MIIFSLNTEKRRRQEMTNTMNKTDISQSLMLVSISLLYLVSQSPVIISTHIESNMNYENFSPELIARLWIMEMAFQLLGYVNNVANFFCYCISGSKFREEFVEMLREWKNLKPTKNERNIYVHQLSTAVSVEMNRSTN